MGSENEGEAEAIQSLEAQSEEFPHRELTDEAQARRRRLWARAGAAASVFLVAIAFFVLSRTLANLDIGELRAAFSATSCARSGSGWGSRPCPT